MSDSIEPVLLSCVRLETKSAERTLTNATGFFFERDTRLFVITCRHVVTDPATGHAPDSLCLFVHTDPSNLAATSCMTVALRSGGAMLWREATDTAGTVDAVAVPIDPTLLSSTAHYRAFGVDDLYSAQDGAEVGDPVIVVGFPLGFHDTLHELPVARASMIASSFGFRFDGQGYFLTDGRLHRGASGAPVLKRKPAARTGGAMLPWTLLGVHSARVDSGRRDADADEALGLNVAWYADILTTLTAT